MIYTLQIIKWEHLVIIKNETHSHNVNYSIIRKMFSKHKCKCGYGHLHLDVISTTEIMAKINMTILVTAITQTTVLINLDNTKTHKNLNLAAVSVVVFVKLLKSRRTSPCISDQQITTARHLLLHVYFCLFLTVRAPSLV